MPDFNYRSIPLGAHPSPVDERDWNISRLVPSIPSEVEPDVFELDINEIKNQGSIGECVSASGCGIREGTEKSQTGSYTKLAIGFNYGNRETTDYQGIGMYPREYWSGVLKYGIPDFAIFPTEKEWPDIQSEVNKSNRPAVLANAYPRRISAYARLANVAEIKLALRTLGQVHVVVPVYDSFYSTSKSSPIVPIPNISTETLYGSHALRIVGYNNKTRLLKIANSWGDGWAENGCCYFSYDWPFIELWSVTDNILPAPPEPKKVYTLTMTTEKQSYSPNELIMFNIHTSIPSQKVSCIFNRPSNPYPYNPVITTDTSGNFANPIVEGVAGTLKGNVKWVDPNGDTQEVTMSVQIVTPEPKPEPPKPEPTKLYRVQVGAFGVKANADKLAAELKAKGYPVFVVQY